MNPNESSVYGRPNTFKYTMFIDDDITSPCNYRDEFDLLENAQEGDIVTININSGGGRLDTTLQFISLIDTCQGHVITKLSGQACSGAAMILLSGHEIQISSLAELMAHSASGGYGGKVSDIASYAKHSESHTNDIMDNIYQGFLTDEEMLELHKGKEFWMKADEISSRLEQRSKIRQEIMQEHKQAMDAELELLTLPEPILNKLTKKQLVDFYMERIEIQVNEDGSYEVIPVDTTLDD